jgi:hypothetical protein
MVGALAGIGATRSGVSNASAVLSFVIGAAILGAVTAGVIPAAFYGLQSLFSGLASSRRSALSNISGARSGREVLDVAQQRLVDYWSLNLQQNYVALPLA